MRIALPFLIASFLPAQTPSFLVLPRECALRDGSTNNAYPFSADSMWSYQQIHDDLAGRPRLISELALRPENNSPNSACTMSLTLRLSTTPVPSAGAMTLFSANHGSDLTEVLTRTAINWPGTTGPSNPAIFPFALPFLARPFLYKNTGGLCWEVRIHSNSLGSTWASRDAHQPAFIGTNYGLGCVATGLSKPAAHTLSIRPAAPLTAWDVQCKSSALPATVPALWMIGGSDKFWGPVPLPFDLTPLGAPGCSLHTSVLISTSGLTSPAGAFDTSFPVPFDSSVVGATVYSQVLAVDQPKVFPVTTTNGYSHVVPGIGIPVARIYQRSDDQALTGYVGTDFGLVVRIAYL